MTKLQDLVKANGFIKGFSSITADSNADQALLYNGNAAMMLHGSWSYGIQKTDGGDFVSSGALGYMNFPPVEGGKGDPSDTVGNPGQYLAISSKASAEQKEVAKKFFTTGVLDDQEVKDWIGSGGVPILKGTQKELAGQNADFVTFIYDTASKAKVFAQSWDQALSPPRPRPCWTTSPSCSSCPSRRSSSPTTSTRSSGSECPRAIRRGAAGAASCRGWPRRLWCSSSASPSCRSSACSR